MKVLFCSHLGEEKEPVARAWAKWLRTEGHDITFVVPRGGYGRLPSLKEGRKVRKTLRGKDVIICCDIWSLMYVYLNPGFKAMKVYSCFELYSEIVPWNLTVKIERKWIEWLEGRLIRSDWKWIFGNEERRTFYNSKYSGRGGDVILNYPAPVDLDLFDCRRELTSILLVGTINNRIPIADLKFIAWYCSCHRIKLVIAGSIQDQFRELEDYSSVELLPYKKGDEYVELLAQSSLGFAAYVKEGKNYELCAPVKVYDYLYSGMPLLTSDQVTLKSMATDTPGMRTYELGNFESLHQQLEELRLNWGHYSKEAMDGVAAYQDDEHLFGRGLRAVLELDSVRPSATGQKLC